MDRREAVDIVNLIEDDEAEDSSDAWDGSETEVGIGVMSFCDEGDLVFETGKELIVVVEEIEVKFDTFSDTFIGESFSHSHSVSFTGDALF